MKTKPVRYCTVAGREVPAVTANQMREIDRIAIEETGPNLFQMMENAGRNLALHALDMLGTDWRDRHTLVLAGAGGNGGGGICAARHLANHGANVTLVLAAPLAARSIPAFQHHVYSGTSGREIAPSALNDKRPDLLIDALIGYGLAAAPRRTVADIIHWANDTGMPILSLDVPSGVDATTGETRGVVIRPASTMTLALPKQVCARRTPATWCSLISAFLQKRFVGQELHPSTCSGRSSGFHSRRYERRENPTSISAGGRAPFRVPMAIGLV